MKSLRIAIASAFMAGMMFKPVQAAENIVFSCFFPPQHYVCKNYVPEMAKRVADATENRVKIRMPPKSLTSPQDVYDGVKKGVMDGGLQFNAFLVNEAPGMGFTLLPFVGKQESGAMSVALWKTYQKFFADKGEFDDVVLLSAWAINGSDIYSMTDKPIESVDDFANRKMWALPGPTATIVKASGSPVISGPAVQMLEIISKGVVDGYAGISDQSVQQFKLTDYTKSSTVFADKIFQPTFSFFVSKKKWDKIDPKDQQAIREALGEDFAAYMGKFSDGVFAKATKALDEAGVKRIKGSDEFLAALKKLGEPLIDAWKEKIKPLGVNGDEVIEYYHQAYAEAKASMEQ